MFGVAYVILTAVKLGWRDIWLSSLVAATGCVVLQTFGALYIKHIVAGASDTYGTFRHGDRPAFVDVPARPGVHLGQR